MEKTVAIKYNNDYPAPFVIASGKGSLARKIKKIAQQNNIDILSSTELVDNLMEIELGSFIPENLYEIIAEILNFVYQIKENDEKF